MGNYSDRDGDILVSFLIPTRKRLGMLHQSIKSIRETCKNINSFEVVVIFDEDDEETLNEFNKLNFDFKTKVIVSKRFGYYGLHEYINNAFRESSGKWFWLWNDDLTMVSKNWDQVIREYKNKFLILNPSNAAPGWRQYCVDATISPIVPRAWFEVLGRFSAYNQYDTYINSVAYPLNLVVNETRLQNSHEQVDDEVSSGISYEKMQLPKEESLRDQALLRSYLGKDRLVRYWIERIPYRSSKYIRRRIAHFKRMSSSAYIAKKFKQLLSRD